MTIMKPLLFSILLLFSPLALAASSLPAINIRSILWDIAVLVAVGLVLGIVAYLVKAAPFIVEPIKSFIIWGILVVACLLLIYIILGFAGL